MDFSLSKEQTDIKRAAREFAEVYEGTVEVQLNNICKKVDGIRLTGFSPAVSVVYQLANSCSPEFIPSEFGTSPGDLSRRRRGSKKKQLRGNLNRLQS